MKKTTIFALVLGALVVLSIVQATQLSGLKEKVSEGQLTVRSAGGSAPAVSAGSSSPRTTASVPSSIKNLPQMVGGC